MALPTTVWTSEALPLGVSPTLVTEDLSDLLVAEEGYPFVLVPEDVSSAWGAESLPSTSWTDESLPSTTWVSESEIIGPD